MAAEEGEFLASQRRAGREILAITLLAPSLGDPSGRTSPDQLRAWAEAFDLREPILAERAWGPLVVGGAGDSPYAWPGWALSDPDGVVVAAGTGFSGWDALAAVIAEASR
jgi:hypothetical protein